MTSTFTAENIQILDIQGSAIVRKASSAAKTDVLGV